MSLLENIKAYLLSEKFRPGDRIPPEEDLAKYFKTSRSKIREVTTTLCLQGILEKKARRGTVILEPDPKQFCNELIFRFKLTHQNTFDCMEARKVIEKAIVPLAVRRITPMQMQKLGEIVRKMEQLTLSPAEMDELDCQFHLTLLEGCGNNTLQTIGQIIQGLFNQQFRQDYHSDSLMKKTAAAHRELYNAVRNSDSTKVVELVENHFNAPEE